MQRSWIVAIFGLVAALFSPLGMAAAAEPEPIDFNRDIRPLLSETCLNCHGFDLQQRQAGLRLDTFEGATEELESGARAIVPGDPDESELVYRITSKDPSDQMPPPDSGKALKPEQIELLVRWVKEGAEYKQHWAFEAPERPEPPPVKHESWARNPIDHFVAARLEHAGLEPSPEADKVTLLRRVSYDLTGLPPTPAEVDAFLADQSPDAYEKVVERLLASPRYGEHMARYWLDAVRYADTHGLHFDNARAIWPYRDWVVRAFNENLPFDQFTVEQIAGDLLPNPTRSQLIATGFGRCNPTTNEGGSIEEEVLARYAIDRTESVGTVWLGLTIGCAVCHDHKYDPVTQKEFYELYAFFNGLADKAMDGNIPAPPPVIKVPTAEQEAREKELNDQIAAVQKKIADELAKVEYHEPPGAASAPREPHEFVWVDDELPPGAKPAADGGDWKFVSQLDRPVYSGQQASFRKAEGVAQHYFTEAEPKLVVGEGDRLFTYVYLDPADPPKTVMLQFNDGSWEHRAYWGEDLIPFGAKDTPGKQHLGPLPEPGKWVRLEVEAAKVGLNPGAKLNGWAFTQHGGTVFWDKAGIVTRTPQAGQQWESLAAWEHAARAATSLLPAEIEAALKLEPEKRTAEQTSQLRNYFLENIYAGTRDVFKPLHDEVAALNKQLSELDAAIPRTLVMADMEKPRDTHVLIRGAYDKKGEKVTPDVPEILPELPEGMPANRLALAKWLVDAQHPLTARVVVNRFWQQYFGTGIVETSEDFGTRAEYPTHLKLLDWLATEFIRTGWDMKHMQRLIVTSNTYRQSSKVTPELLARDPANKLLARGPRFRLDAEAIRDTALYASGLLVEKLGGPGVKPYQPEGLWEAVGFLGSDTREYKQDHGDALYRRSLYNFWKRTSPPPMLSGFDAPSRETCTVRRPRTNTPLQALNLMNDVQFVEASRKLAARMLAEGGESAEARAKHGFRLATGREPKADELAVLMKTWALVLAEYAGDKESAEKLLALGESPRNNSLEPAEHAAWTVVANMILNLDETVTKE